MYKYFHDGRPTTIQADDTILISFEDGTMLLLRNETALRRVDVKHGGENDKIWLGGINDPAKAGLTPHQTFVVVSLIAEILGLECISVQQTERFIQYKLVDPEASLH